MPCSTLGTRAALVAARTSSRSPGVARVHPSRPRFEARILTAAGGLLSGCSFPELSVLPSVRVDCPPAAGWMVRRRRCCDQGPVVLMDELVVEQADEGEVAQV